MGFALPSAMDNRPMKFEEWEKFPSDHFCLCHACSIWAWKSEQVVEQVVRPTGLVDPILEIRPVLTQVDDILGEINLKITRWAGFDYHTDQTHGRGFDQLFKRIRY